MNAYEKADLWSQKARAAGYPARSVFKLEEIMRKFPILPAGFSRDCAALELGAAPGSWSLFLLRSAAARAGRMRLVACDMQPLSREFDGGLFDGAAFVFLRGDMLSPEVAGEIGRLGPYALVLSDAAPATSGNRALDAPRSLELAGAAFRYAQAHLAPGGSFVAKVFQGDGSADFLKEVRAAFSMVKAFKPQACRASSFETYVIGLGKRSGDVAG